MSIAQPPVLASATHQRPRVASAQAHDASAKAARIRRLGLKSAFSLVDQGLTAAVGFGVNLALARWLPARIYGAFAVAFAGYLFVGGFTTSFCSSRSASSAQPVMPTGSALISARRLPRT